MGHSLPLEKVLKLAKLLSPRDKLRLIERIAPQIECDLKGSSETSRRSLRGLWRGHDLTPEEIAEARRETWRCFPRGDI